MARTWLVNDHAGDQLAAYWTEDEDTAKQARKDGATVIEYVPVSQLDDLLSMIIDADKGDWDRTIPTLAQYAEIRRRELGEQ